MINIFSSKYVDQILGIEKTNFGNLWNIKLFYIYSMQSNISLSYVYFIFVGIVVFVFLKEIQMLKFDTADIVRIVENTKGLNNEEVVLAMLEDDDVVTSTMKVTVSNQDLIKDKDKVYNSNFAKLINISRPEE